MSKKDKQSKKSKSENYDLLIEISLYQRWLAERHERANEALSNRATTILGFLGVEIAVFAAVSPKNFKHPYWIGGLGFAAALLILAAVFCLFKVLWAKEFHWPPEDIAKVAVTWPEDHQVRFLGEAIYSPLDTSRNIFKSLGKENETLVRWFHSAIWATGFAQCLLVVTIALMWRNVILGNSA